MAHAFRAALCGAYLLGTVGCTTEPIVVRMPNKEAFEKGEHAIAGPVFFMPTVEFQLTIPLELEGYEPEDKPLLMARPSSDPAKPMRLESVRRAESRFPLVLTDKAGVLMDVTKFELELDEHSVLTNFNRTAEDKTGEIAKSVVKLAFTAAGVGTRSAERKGTKLETPAEIVFTFAASQIPRGDECDLETLIQAATDRSFKALFWSQNVALEPNKFTDVELTPVKIVRTVTSAFEGHAMIPPGTWAPENVGKILCEGVKGIPYRIPATHTFVFSFNDGGLPQTARFDTKSPEDQPLLYAPIRARRFGTASSAVTIGPNGAVAKYTRTQTSAAKGAADSALGVAEQLKADMSARAQTRTQEQTDKYELAIKLRTRLKEKADLEAAIEALAAQPHDARVAQELRDKRAELDVINIKIQALYGGIDLP